MHQRDGRQQQQRRWRQRRGSSGTSIDARAGISHLVQTAVPLVLAIVPGGQSRQLFEPAQSKGRGTLRGLPATAVRVYGQCMVCRPTCWHRPAPSACTAFIVKTAAPTPLTRVALVGAFGAGPAVHTVLARSTSGAWLAIGGVHVARARRAAAAAGCTGGECHSPRRAGLAGDAAGAVGIPAFSIRADWAGGAGGAACKGLAA